MDYCTQFNISKPNSHFPADGTLKKSSDDLRQSLPQGHCGIMLDVALFWGGPNRKSQSIQG
jgi:hypothetical protein